MAVLAVQRTPAGHAVSELRRGERVAPRILARGSAIRAAFVPTQAGPLAGDRDSARIVVGAGATLIVEPVAATLALPGGPRTVLRLDITVHPSGRLVLDEGPLIVAAGADVERRCTIELGAGSIAALRETVVLGRDGEPPGALDGELRVTLAGRALLHDGLRHRGAGSVDDHVVLAPAHRVLCSTFLLGVRPPAAPDDGVAVMDLAGPGAVLRATAMSLAAADAAIAATWRRWSGAVA